MDRYPAHKLASLCQRMPLDVYVLVNMEDYELGNKPIRVVKSEFVKELRNMDGRNHVGASLNLDGIYIQF